ncbi:MAG TPA: acetylglutamate kinase [Candidatus Kapabacteria bacterium]|nr:acetylglutamate kinase [Candidatus Kapabacteria bacterium]
MEQGVHDNGIAGAHALPEATERAGLRGKTVVVKYGGAAMDLAEAKDALAADAAALRAAGVNLVIVHGGGNDITDLAARLGIETEFVEGHRVTSAAMLDVATMVLAGRINKDLVLRLAKQGGRAIGLSGLDNNLITARRRASGPDLGQVGEVAGVNAGFLRMLLSAGLLPVLAPLGIGEDGTAYNINADLAAGAVAAALDASVLLYMSNVDGVMANGVKLDALSESRALGMIAAKTIAGGMIPKVEAALHAAKAGARSVRIVDGSQPHALAAALANPESGTTILREQQAPVYQES